ncbi:MAG: heavy metal translocating P-type ATPase [Desulfuromonadaceae bacterium]|nr:heavy metal translocating P-type ATPase [Desulfuromonadaceae bacterium]
MKTKQINIPVYGMKCSNCVAKVTGIIQGFAAVEHVEVSLSEQLAKIVFSEPIQHPLGEIRQALATAGYQTENPVEPDTSKSVSGPPVSAADLEPLRFKIVGMSCASCAATIEKKLNTLNGVQDVTVNLAGVFGQLKYDPQLVSAADVYAAVAAAGYQAGPVDKMPDHDDEAARELRLVLIAATGALPIMLLMFVPVFGERTILINAALASLVQFTAGLGFYQSAWKSLKNRAANMDLLVSLGITAAYGYSLLALSGMLGDDATVFFETSAMLILFIRFGKWLESRAKGRAGAALRNLLKLQADHAVLLVDGREEDVPASRIKPGDLLLVRAGEKIPVDAVVVEGSAAIDESMITGEAVPVDKSTGAEVTGATINRSGRLLIKAVRVGEQTVLAQIVRLVEEAQGDKAPIQRLADRVANFFVPTIVVLSLLTFFSWYLLAAGTFLFAFQMAIAVVVIACPCALGLATPTAIMVGSSVGLERGILFKKASVLEQISKLQIILLDKTGTLTSGDFTVSELVCFDECLEEQLLQFAAALESGSNHPLAKSIVAEARKRGLKWSVVAQVEEVGGLGLKGQVSGRQVLCGRQKLLEDNACDLSAGAPAIKRLTTAGKTQVFLAVDGRLKGIIALADSLKPHAATVITGLKKLGIRTVLLTGDRRSVAEAVAAQIGIDQVEAEVLPEQKLLTVKKYQQQGLLVGMVGDGINDAPALAQADIGIAIGSGTDVAKETGDLILVGGDLCDIERGIRLGRQTLRKIKQNLFWAFFYNLLGVPLAAGVLYPLWGLYLKPEFAGLAMAFSSVSVVANSLLLRRLKDRL